MGLSEGLRRFGLSRPPVLLVTVPGVSPLGWQVESELRRRRWGLAVTPADASLLVVAGAPGHEMRAAVDRVWEQVPAPRARAEVLSADDVPRVLDAALASLLDWPEQQRTARALAGRDPQEDLAATGGTGHADTGHDDMDHDMGPVAGLPMAMAGEDRDGLHLDVLSVSLGPLLPDWPVGLVLDAQLSGDVVTSVEVRVLDGASQVPTTAGGVPPRALVADRLSSLLAVAGWDAAAEATRRVRDGLVAGVEPTSADRRWLHRVARSRALRWSLRGVAVRDGRDAADRARAWVREVAGDQPESPERPFTPQELDAAVVGQELGAARLAVASLPSLHVRDAVQA